MSARDQDAIAIVATRIHRIDGKRVCKCDVCRSFRRVVSLARESARGTRSAAVGAGVRGEACYAEGRAVITTLLLSNA